MTDREERFTKSIETLQKMREVMINDENWENLTPEIEAVTHGGMALQAVLMQDEYYISKSVIEDIKSEIRSIQPKWHENAGKHNCIDEVIKIIDKHISGKEE